ncbi:MAG: low molecular weight phosphotyrosine protein phosphatase [Atopobiaceae bacterium]|nr:low molecular weight phosphotyrosine protein phosphatase [Atopobiaceae bacterium]
MVRILMVCLGNICRSPMAEYVMRHLVRQAGLEREIAVDSAATSRYQIGDLPHRGTQRVLAEHGIPCGRHRARQIVPSDYQRYDLIIGMDDENCEDILYLLRGDPQHKVRSLLDWTDHPRDIADPWYTGDFETTYADVLEGCKALLMHLTR